MCEFEGPPCAQSLCRADTATSERPNALLRPEAFVNTCAPSGCREKSCVRSVEVCQGN